MPNTRDRVDYKRSTDEYWSQVNPIIPDMEIILVTVDGVVRFKVGDGLTAYNDLPFYYLEESIN